MKVDLHVHAMERSYCAVSGEEEMIQAAISRGLDGLAFTDHHRLVPPQRITELCQKYAPFRVFSGIEINVSGEDILVLGLDDPDLDTRSWAYPTLHRFVRQRGGFMILAHPFRFHNFINVDIETYRPDGIEVRSMNIRTQNVARIRALAEQLDLLLVCNSDAHQARDVGAYYNILSRTPRDDSDLVSILMDGDYGCSEEI